MSEPLRILSVDGGGVRGLIPAEVLAELEKRLAVRVKAPARLSDYFHLFAGTSTGGLISLALTAPGGPPATKLPDLYTVDGPKIFKRSHFGTIFNPIGIFGPIYGAGGLQSSLEERLGPSRLSQATRDLLVTAYDMTKREPFFFTRWQALKDPSRDYPIVDAGLATSAAPTYFPSHGVKVGGEAEPRALVDGGVFADDPSIAAIAEALGRAKDPPAELTPQDLFMVSLGTGRYVPGYRQSDISGWGKIRWAVLGEEPPLISAMLNGSADGADYWTHMLLNHAPGDEPPGSAAIGHGPRYFRLQVDLPSEVTMDNASSQVLDVTLPAAAKQLITTHDADLNAIVDKLAEAGPIPPLP
ncbi:MAG TPA: patatin-like phospholipase family protein [Solirubrobacterales bacterium]